MIEFGVHESGHITTCDIVIAAQKTGYPDCTGSDIIILTWDTEAITSLLHPLILVSHNWHSKTETLWDWTYDLPHMANNIPHSHNTLHISNASQIPRYTNSCFLCGEHTLTALHILYLMAVYIESVAYSTGLVITQNVKCGQGFKYCTTTLEMWIISKAPKYVSRRTTVTNG